MLEKVTFALLLPFVIKIIHTLPKTELHAPQCADVGRYVGPCPGSLLSRLRHDKWVQLQLKDKKKKKKKKKGGINSPPQ